METRIFSSCIDNYLTSEQSPLHSKRKFISPRGLAISSKCVPQKHLKNFVYFEFGFEVIKLDYLDREAVKANYERK